MKKKVEYLLVGVLIGIILGTAEIVFGQFQRQKPSASEMATFPKDTLLLKDFAPVSCLATPDHTPKKAKFPAIDAHIHIGLMNRGLSVGDQVKIMDACGVQTLVNVNGLSPQDIIKFNEITSPYPGRFITYTRLDWKNLMDPGFAEYAAKELEEAKKAGAKGIGEIVEKGEGFGRISGVHCNHKNLKPVWDKCGELGLVVSLHVGDPVSFYRPLDRFNERWDELILVPNFLRYGKDIPGFNEMIEMCNETLKNHPKTIFICCHHGNYAENLAYVGEIFDKYPNFYVDMSERLGELGRQPFTARKHFIKYQDRIVFGTDRSVSEETFRIHWRFFETEDEYFKYRLGSFGAQGRWGCYGINLPDEVLEKVYNKNFKKLVKF